MAHSCFSPIQDVQELEHAIGRMLNFCILHLETEKGAMSENCSDIHCSTLPCNVLYHATIHIFIIIIAIRMYNYTNLCNYMSFKHDVMPND